mgnify:CR=1 FL=1
MLTADEFDRAVREAMPTLKRTALRLTGTQSDADDVLQDGLMRAWIYRHKFEGGNFLGWACVVMTYQYFAVLRRKRHRPEGHCADINVQPARFDDMDRHLDAERTVRAILDDIFPRTGDSLLPVLSSLAIDEDSYEVVAKRLALELGTVKSRMFRARAKLQRMLGTDRYAICVGEPADPDFVAYDEIIDSDSADR